MDWNCIIEPKFFKDRETKGRNDFERDYDRVIFSSPFRRLNDKTQVFPIPKNYFVHNRFTHSIETSCVGRSLGHNAAQRIAELRSIEKEDKFIADIGDIVKTACLAHDIGNPPFGHSGEDAISSFFEQGRGKEILKKLTPKEKQDLLSFEGNAQGFRLLSRRGNGLQLTYNVLAAFIKYPKESGVTFYIDKTSRDRKDQKKYGFFQAEKDIFLQVAAHFGMHLLTRRNDKAYSRFPLAYLVEAADDICYLIMDLEDAVRLNILPLDSVKSILLEIIRENQQDFQLQIDNGGDDNTGMSILRAASIHSLVMQCTDVFIAHLEEIEQGSFTSSLTNSISSRPMLDQLELIAKTKIYNYKPVLEIESAGFEVINGLMDILFGIIEKPDTKFNYQLTKLFPPHLFNCHYNDLRQEHILNITDYISGMTDNYAIDLYRKIKGVSLPEVY